MATESADGFEMSVQLPKPLAEWLEKRAEAEELDRDELLGQLLAAYRVTTENDEVSIPNIAGVVEAELDERLGTDARGPGTDEFDERLSTLEDDFEADIEDVRQRVLQLRDAVQNRAPADHDHVEFDRIDGVAERAERLSEEVESIGVDTAEANDRIGAVEERLEDVESKVNRLARIVVALRREAGEGKSEDQRLLERLKRTAATEDIGKATCTGCGESVRIGLLMDPACPHCGMNASDVIPAESFFRKPKLVGVEAPALEGETGTYE